MKKIILAIALIATTILAGVGIAKANQTTLYDCYQQLELGWPTVQERALSGVPAQHGIWGYEGTADQNKALSSYLCPNDDLLGYSVVSGYEKNLRTSMNSTQDYVPVTSLLLKDSTELSMTLLGDKVFLTLEPGSAREEIVKCTTIDDSAINFETCTRGLAFSGTTETSVSANRKAHGAGTKVVMSNVHYVYEQLTDKDTAETVAGNWNFTSPTSTIFNVFPTVSSSAYTGLPTLDGEMATKYYVDTVGAGGFTSANVSTTKGIEVYGTAPETLGVNVSSTMGMYGGADGQGIYQKVQSDTGLENETAGIKINTTTLVDLIATSTPTASLIPIADSDGKVTDWIDTQFGGDGSDGALSLVSTTLTIDLTSSSTLVKEYTSISIDASSTLDFATSSATGSYIILKSQGDCTIAGDIDMTGMGGDAGTGGATSEADGTVGKDNTLILDDAVHYGDFGNGGEGAGGGEGGTGGLIFADNLWFYTMVSEDRLSRKTLIQFTGAGGGGGGAGVNANFGVGGVGGGGGGAILIQCNGALNFTGTIDVSGKDGGDANDAVISATGGGGGGGGSAGTAIILYNTLTANSGTITASGGDGGDGGGGKNAGIANATGGGGAAGAGSYSGAGGNGASGDTNAGGNGSNGGAVGCGAGGGAGGGANQNDFAGGNGGTGGASDTNHYLITENNWF